jgi:hypothetical protein
MKGCRAQRETKLGIFLSYLQRKKMKSALKLYQNMYQKMRQ